MLQQKIIIIIIKASFLLSCMYVAAVAAEEEEDKIDREEGGEQQRRWCTWMPRHHRWSNCLCHHLVPRVLSPSSSFPHSFPFPSFFRFLSLGSSPLSVSYETTRQVECGDEMFNIFFMLSIPFYAVKVMLTASQCVGFKMRPIAHL